MFVARTRLRAATAAAHAKVDQILSHFDLSSATGYGAFLAAHAAALLPIEAWLDAHAPAVIADWPARRRGEDLLADLAALGETSRAGPAFSGPESPAGVMGVLYVVEGSRLGGRVLARRVAPGLPAAYLTPRAHAPSWPALLQRLDEIVKEAAAEQAAIDAALQTFTRFAQAGQRAAIGCPA